MTGTAAFRPQTQLVEPPYNRASSIIHHSGSGRVRKFSVAVINHVFCTQQDGKLVLYCLKLRASCLTMFLELELQDKHCIDNKIQIHFESIKYDSM